MEFGVQTFTIRKAQKKDIEKAYLPLVEMGITTLEVARIDFNQKNADEIWAIMGNHNIRPVSIQVKPKYVFGHPEQVIEFCKTTECKNVVISQLPFKCVLGREELFYNFISTLDTFYEKYEKEGITLAFHHHNWEYIKLSNGKTRMEELLSKTKKIKFVHDTYWTARCGIDPSDQIKEFGDRLLGIHMRDLTFKKKNIQVIPHDCAIGDGVIRFDRVLEAARQVGCSYFVIEQNTKDPYNEIKKSFERLNRLSSSYKE